MKSLFNSAKRQSNALQRDLNQLADASTVSPALQGQIHASLTSFSRTIDEYNTLARQEIVSEKQERATSAVQQFRLELVQYRRRFDGFRKEVGMMQTTVERAELLGRRPQNAIGGKQEEIGGFPNKWNSTQPRTSEWMKSLSNSETGTAAGQSSMFASPQLSTSSPFSHAPDSFTSKTSAQLDTFLERGRAVLSDLHTQQDMLKRTQRRLRTVATTLGLSAHTIRTIEKRARSDKVVFWVGALTLFGFVWALLWWVR